MHLDVSLDAAEGAKGILLTDPLEVDAVNREDLISPP